MFGAIKGIWKVGKVAARAVPVIRDAFDDRKANPVPQGKFERVVVDVADLLRSVKAAKADGKITREEALDLLVDVAMIVLRQFGIDLKRA